MKKTTILGTVLSGVVLATMGTSSVLAEVVVGQEKETPTTVKIVDNTDPANPDVDPLVPTDPDQKMLTLESVPDAYSFESKLQNATYDLSATLTDKSIDVFNDRITREWSVKANVVGDKLTKDTTDFTVASFKVNDAEVEATAADGIVAKAPETKDAATNTGVIKTPVTKVSIAFTDTAKVLKVGDTLNGNIHYQLFNTADAS
jgi:hypothetical protein